MRCLKKKILVWVIFFEYVWVCIVINNWIGVFYILRIYRNYKYLCVLIEVYVGILLY